MKCKCGKEFDTPTKLSVHQLSGNCASTVKRHSSSSNSSYRYRKTGLNQFERDAHGRPKVDNGLPEEKQRELERKGAEDGTTAHDIYRWHLPLSVYYHSPALDTSQPGKAVLNQLRELDKRIYEAVKELDLEGIVVFDVRPGWNVNACRLKQEEHLTHKLAPKYRRD